MKLKLERFLSDENATVGKLYADGEFVCYTLEDEKREVKVKGETRIPAGTYDVKKREVLSGLTKKYREKYDFFDYHYQLQNVPNFNYVYIHMGNYETNTDGCILVGSDYGEHKDTYAVWNSGATFEKVYKMMENAGSPISIEVVDEQA